jgi:tRNA pseudouridine55 synthase
MARRKPSPFHGVLVVDKPEGPTSHDVVRWVRRALGTRTVGHAGTLDPMATGVLVIGIGEATKLVPYLTAHDKVYWARIALGQETTTLDAQGEVCEQLPTVELSRERWQALADGFLGEREQQVPRVSAVRIDGERAHALARRGEDFEPPTRTVTAHALDVLEVEPGALAVRLHCGKGFFVRSFARDLARAAGTRAHLTALRRERSGPFSVQEAVAFEDIRQAAEAPEHRAALAARLLPLAQACGRTMPTVEVSEMGRQDAFHGRPVALGEALGPTGDDGGVVCLLDRQRSALALARRTGDALHVVRGFRGTEAAGSPGEPSVS